MGSTAADEKRRAAAWQLLIATVQFGEATGAAIAARAEDPTLAQNAPIAVITELALRGPRRPSQLATFTGLTSGGVTKMVDRLEESGLVARTVGEVPRDRRAVTVRLTDKGEQLARAVADAVLEQMSLLRALTAELTGLIDVIDDEAETWADQAGISRRRAPKRPAPPSH